jgi:hypothetical protein
VRQVGPREGEKSAVGRGRGRKGGNRRVRLK